ncbi:4033_t:CDS:2 [Acaulospora morrowiae]|uniref:4033_t:CDS:1 n=1 Tax=Acaulospora morrowiae TaxID=94023 RepID=A0A9N8VNA0_9GLOM|nr:4033_t:CDS:2 [Acaulospora morrowiae]
MLLNQVVSCLECYHYPSEKAPEKYTLDCPYKPPRPSSIKSVPVVMEWRGCKNFITVKQQKLGKGPFFRWDINYLENGSLLSDETMAIGRGVLSVLKGTENAAHLGTALYWDNEEHDFWLRCHFLFGVTRYPLKSLLSLNKGDSKYNDGDFDVSLDLAEECIVGREKQARFDKVLKIDFNGDGKKDVIIASEHSSSYYDYIELKSNKDVSIRGGI